MDLLLYIFTENIAPIFLIISLGYILNNFFEIDINTLNKLNFYIFVPALVLIQIYNTELKLEMLNLVYFSLLFLVIISLLSNVISKFRNYGPSLTNAFKNSTIFFNAGNYSLPLIALIFNNSAYAFSIQVMILILQTLLIYTVGFFNAGKGQVGLKSSLKKVFIYPPIYMIILAFVLKTFSYDFSEFFLWPAMEYLEQGFISIALLTLGVQLSRIKINLEDPSIYIASFFRLLGGPLIAYLLIIILGIDGVMAKVLFITSAAPTAVTTALIAVEYDNQSSFASQVVMMTTLLSVFSVTFVIYLSEIIF
ncbi:MAG: AEC family transporter [Bacillota bacterium]